MQKLEAANTLTSSRERLSTYRGAEIEGAGRKELMMSQKGQPIYEVDLEFLKSHPKELRPRWFEITSQMLAEVRQEAKLVEKTIEAYE